MATNSEIEVFENFPFKIGSVVIRVTNNGDDLGMVVGRMLEQSTAGIRRCYAVAFESVIGNEWFEEVELMHWVSSNT